MSEERLIQIIQAYVSYDAEAAEPDYIRMVLTDICGLTEEELRHLGFDWVIIV